MNGAEAYAAAAFGVNLDGIVTSCVGRKLTLAVKCRHPCNWRRTDWRRDPRLPK